MASNHPSFIDEFLADMIDVRQRKGVIHIVPWMFAAFIGGATYAAFQIPGSFFSPSRWDIPATVYGGVLTFNAITLALSWTAMGRILEIISTPGFSSFLKQKGLINRYSFYVSFIHVIQIAAATMTLFALMLMFIPQVPEWGQRVVLGFMFGLTLYALKWSVGAVTLASHLILQFAAFDGLDDAAKANLRLAVNNK